MVRSNAIAKECDGCGMICPNNAHWDELDKCLCCGKQLCKWCLKKHGRIATDKKRIQEALGPHHWSRGGRQ